MSRKRKLDEHRDGHERRFDDFRKSMKSLLETGKHSDYIIVCGDDTYNVHKSIICSQCDFFEAASKFGKEGEEGKVDLVDDEPDIVRHMIQYLYELDYHIPSEKVSGPWAFQLERTKIGNESRTPFSTPERRRSWDMLLWQTSATLMPSILAKYPNLCVQNPPKIITLNIHEREHREVLRDFSEHFRVHKANPAWIKPLPLPIHADDLGIHAEVYALADKYNIKGLKDLAYEKFVQALSLAYTDEKFFETVDTIYTSTPQSDVRLREKVAAHLVSLKIHHGIYKQLRRALESHHELAYYMLCQEWKIDIPDRPSVPEARNMSLSG